MKVISFHYDFFAELPLCKNCQNRDSSDYRELYKTLSPLQMVACDSKDTFKP